MSVAATAAPQGLLFVLPRPLPTALLPGGAANADFATALSAAVAEEGRIPLVPELEEPGGKWLSQVRGDVAGCDPDEPVLV